MLGFNALGTAALAAGHYDVRISDLKRRADLSVSSLVIPERPTDEGVLVQSTSLVWMELVDHLGEDWSAVFQLTPPQLEELVAGAFKKAGYDEVTLTPRSGDHGRDVIAKKKGVGCIKIINSVKAYHPGNLVDYDAIRALLGVMTGERDTSKGMITTTSDFPPNLRADPFIAPFLPTRLELMNGEGLRRWLAELARN